MSNLGSHQLLPQNGIESYWILAKISKSCTKRFGVGASPTRSPAFALPFQNNRYNNIPMEKIRDHLFNWNINLNRQKNVFSCCSVLYCL